MRSVSRFALGLSFALLFVAGAALTTPVSANCGQWPSHCKNSDSTQTDPHSGRITFESVWTTAQVFFLLLPD